MAVNLDALNAQIEQTRAQVARLTTVKDGVVALLNAQGQAIITAVTTALQADNEADQGSINAAVAAATEVTAGFVTQVDGLSQAVTDNTPPPPPPPPPAASSRR